MHEPSGIGQLLALYPIELQSRVAVLKEVTEACDGVLGESIPDLEDIPEASAVHKVICSPQVEECDLGIGVAYEGLMEGEGLVGSAPVGTEPTLQVRELVHKAVDVPEEDPLIEMSASAGE